MSDTEKSKRTFEKKYTNAKERMEQLLPVAKAGISTIIDHLVEDNNTVDADNAATVVALQIFIINDLNLQTDPDNAREMFNRMKTEIEGMLVASDVLIEAHTENAKEENQG